ncbi:Uma2 family endonuclease, partial [Aphanizomenon sp. 202]|nr:Uma2 family endonuclease [Aphanizomenon sp. 202]
MVQVLPKSVTFDEFCEWYPDTGVRYELHDGVIVEMNPFSFWALLIKGMNFSLTQRRN